VLGNQYRWALSTSWTTPASHGGKGLAAKAWFRHRRGYRSNVQLVTVMQNRSRASIASSSVTAAAGRILNTVKILKMLLKY
jgi:hypothetical protein